MRIVKPSPERQEPPKIVYAIDGIFVVFVGLELKINYGSEMNLHN